MQKLNNNKCGGDNQEIAQMQKQMMENNRQALQMQKQYNENINIKTKTLTKNKYQCIGETLEADAKAKAKRYNPNISPNLIFWKVQALNPNISPNLKLQIKGRNVKCKASTNNITPAGLGKHQAKQKNKFKVLLLVIFLILILYLYWNIGPSR